MFIENKYYKWYISLTSKVNRNLDCYTEKHHIIPRCMGGTDDKDNLVVLTAREHYIAHLLLTKCVTEQYLAKILYAYVMMSTVKDSNQDRTFKINSSLFESKKLQANNFKKEFRHLEEAKEAISKKLKGVKKSPFTEEHRKNISKGGKGRKPWNKGLTGVVKASEETKAKMSESAKGKIVKDTTRKKLSDINKGKVLCYDKVLGKLIKVYTEEYYKNKNTRYISIKTNEYKLKYKELENA